MVVCGITYFVVQENKPESVVSMVRKRFSSGGHCVQYNKKLNGGILTVTADNADLQPKGLILLKNVEATFTKGKKSYVIGSRICSLKVTEKKAYLRENVRIVSGDTVCLAKSAVIDLAAKSIVGNSEIRGSKGKTKFTASGFSMDEHWKIKLKRIRLIK
jgi:hypothetical protein